MIFVILQKYRYTTINLLEYFNFCSLSVDLHTYSEIFCNRTDDHVDLTPHAHGIYPI
jgi:hypothetical protein